MFCYLGESGALAELSAQSKLICAFVSLRVNSLHFGAVILKSTKKCFSLVWHNARTVCFSLKMGVSCSVVMFIY